MSAIRRSPERPPRAEDPLGKCGHICDHPKPGLHAAWFFAAAVAAAARIRIVPIVTSSVSLLSGAYSLVYFWMALRRAYTLSWAGAAFRAAAVGIVYALLVAVVLILIALPVAREIYAR